MDKKYINIHNKYKLHSLYLIKNGLMRSKI